MFMRFLYYLIGKIGSKVYYEKRFLMTTYFSGKFDGFNSIGWKWAFEDTISRVLYNKNRGVPWPVSNKTVVVNHSNIDFSPEDLRIFFSYGCYYQAINAKIKIGEGCWIAPNVGLITTNHNVHDLFKHDSGEDIIIGKNCWIGMNSIILPGVELGDNTVVGAGSVVTKSFHSGNCIIAGNPAKVIRMISKEKEKRND